ncbi:hypothetical protein D9M73_295250 [compost metagenome]
MEDISAKEKPVRITVSSIGKMINNKSLLEKRVNKLPNTMKYIESVKENTTNFQKRRISWAIDQLKDEELEVWKIMRKAGISERFYSGLEIEIKRQIISAKQKF